jgi:hypothetical protein
VPLTRRRLAAALTLGALSASLAAPSLQTASATPTVPVLPNLDPALTQLQGVPGISLSGLQITQIDSALTSLQGLAPGQSAGLTLLNPVNSLNEQLASLTGLTSVLLDLTGLLGLTNPAAPSTVGQMVSDLQQIASDGSAPLLVRQSASEIASALGLADLNQILNQVPGLNSTQISSAQSALAVAQALPLGGSAAGGSLSSLGTVLGLVAGHTSGSNATTLNSIASTLEGSGAIDPSSLLTIVGQLQTLSSALPSPYGQVVGELANGLTGSGSILGGVPGLSGVQVTSLLSTLGTLPGLPAGGTLPPGTLAPVADVLTQIASLPGVSGTPAATVLDSVASTFSGSGSIDPGTLTGLVGQLTGVTGSLPAPLGPAVTQVTDALGLSGTLQPGGGTGGGSTGGGSTGGSGGSTGGTGGSTGTGGGSTPAGSGAGPSVPGAGSPTLTPQQLAYLQWLYGLYATPAGTSTSGKHVRILAARLRKRQVLVSVMCTGPSGQRCSTTVTATQGGHSLGSRHATIAAGSSTHVTFPLAHRSAVKVTVKMGSQRVSRTVR